MPDNPGQRQYADVNWPHIRIDLNRHIVEVEGQIGTNVGFLEQVVCLRGTRDYESIVCTEAVPSQIHAALLLIGLKPGKPGKWHLTQPPPVADVSSTTVGPGHQDAESLPPAPIYAVTPVTGDSVWITVQPGSFAGSPSGSAPSSPAGKEIPVQSWVRDYHSHDLLPPGPWRFGGSFMRQRYNGSTVYAADLSGSIVGLVTFGDEVLGWTHVLPDQDAVMAPEWEANTDAMPKIGAPVIVRFYAQAPDTQSPD